MFALRGCGVCYVDLRKSREATMAFIQDFLRKPFFRLDFLKPKAIPLVGLDISSSAIKMVELSQAGERYTLERYVIQPLPKDAVTDGNVANIDLVAATVRRAWQLLGSRVKQVAIALPASAVITKKVLAPATFTERELEDQVNTEANQYIPFPLDEVNIDFQILGPNQRSPVENDVLIAAARKEKVEERLAVVEVAGLAAVVVDVESYATETAFGLMRQQLSDLAPGRIVAVADIGATAMHMNVFRDGESVYSRDQAYAGNQLTQEIQRRYGLPYDEAERAKCHGGLPPDYHEEVLLPFMENLATEVARALQFFHAATSHGKVDHLLLAGGCSVIPGLAEVIAGRTGIASILRGNPFAGMALGEVNGAQLELDAPALLIACGLAMRRFDPA